MPWPIKPPLFTIDEPAAITGPHGKAWVPRLKHTRPDHAASVSNWIVEAPWAHPIWHSYIIGCVHLREIEGVKPATIVHEGATHEIVVFALDPDHRVDLDQPPRRLTPANYVGQWQAASDAAAAELVEKCVRAICHGSLSPDTDFRRHWERIFGPCT
jgi:hypothetical protein